MKIKHMLAITALILIFAVTACTQYVFDWDSLRPQEITDIEDLILFMQSSETASARLNLTVDPDDSYFPITIKGTKKISGSLKIEESRFPIFSSSTTTPPSSNSRIASTDALFVVADDANLEIANLSATVSPNAVDKVEAIIYVNTGRLTVDSFTTPASVTGLAIGPDAKASKISITDSNIGKIAIDETNKDTGIYDEITNGNTSDAEITTGFDATTAEEFGNALKQFKRVRLMADFSIKNDDIAVDNDSDNSPDPNNSKNPNLNFLDFKGTYSIDLNGHELTSYEPWDLEEGAEIHISNGSLTMINSGVRGLGNPSITLYKNSKLYLDTVNYHSDVTGLFFMNYESSMILDIRDSEIIADGYYGIGTNASEPNSSYDLQLNIINSQVSTTDGNSTKGDNTAILFNVRGNVNIDNSVITGDRQALIARVGTFTINNSTFEATENNDIDHEKYLKRTWESGNEVPSAAIVFGNRSTTAYEYPTKATLENVTTIVPDEEYVFDIYVYQANPISGADRSVSVTGTVSNEVKVNKDNMNGAYYKVN